MEIDGNANPISYVHLHSILTLTTTSRWQVGQGHIHLLQPRIFSVHTAILWQLRKKSWGSNGELEISLIRIALSAIIITVPVN